MYLSFDQSLNMPPQYGILIKSETPSLWKIYKEKLHDLSKMITNARAVSQKCWKILVGKIWLNEEGISALHFSTK